ncbi:HPP family protein [Sulfitobacter pseudonitzschiae]|uniref:HPP family protein n=1 Tax=Pseudosulfitobacter pseudonitzschiae TaxID=1402135 RepID=A0A9Q2NQ89_9RHOB|nr:HPP family protein [Pseudosulfitobacter pseudonitzschiae]MBM2294345.1 HPP family protein [Pseudosulfitobacter pseudonitzschiae]MBM2299270.1 HPP family protein [Pseudosulfitobacter pseudonitzschiae]MBM2304178.1 HPP family protein [Pseudosulfitobacter pseudonitzschiae]MBM2313958.1 HPP family protein [Pseudosulfitobacter pseudonitzschiae]MBM2318872.1 HPP family protein [Pseudosulfitobacter pseudonitzschiae]
MHILKSFGPAVASVPTREALRAGLGALIGLALTGLFLLSPTVDLDLGLYLVAPFGASSVLLFAVPNSPLAQPWSAIVGNTVAALVGVAVCFLVADPALRIALAVGLAITATILCRAVHPPAGAVAMTAAMSPDAIAHLGFWFALTPIAAGTISLVLLAALYARLTGRRYPLRQFADPSTHGTENRNPTERLGLSEEELTGILERYRQSFNLGVEDLARLIGAAELQAAAQSSGPLSAQDIMSRGLVTVSPETPLSEIADLFRQHRFTSLPVVGVDQTFLGVIFQMHLISQARDDALRLDRGFQAAFRRLLDRDREEPMTAADIMSVVGPRATGYTPIGALLPMMAEGDTDAVPVLEYGKIVGIVTRTDLIAALSRSAARIGSA